MSFLSLRQAELAADSENFKRWFHSRRTSSGAHSALLRWDPLWLSPSNIWFGKASKTTNVLSKIFRMNESPSFANCTVLHSFLARCVAYEFLEYRLGNHWDMTILTASLGSKISLILLTWQSQGWCLSFTIPYQHHYFYIFMPKYLKWNLYPWVDWRKISHFSLLNSNNTSREIW